MKIRFIHHERVQDSPANYSNKKEQRTTMKNTLFLSGLMALCCGAGMAATVAIDLNGEAAEGHLCLQTLNCLDSETSTAEMSSLHKKSSHGCKAPPAGKALLQTAIPAPVFTAASPHPGILMYPCLSSTEMLTAALSWEQR
ncbi:MAG: hypothetical protein ACLT38_02490 [Akkermansia sp.]